MRPPSLLLLALVVAGCAPASLEVGSTAVVASPTSPGGRDVLMLIGRDACFLPVGAEVKVVQLADDRGRCMVHVPDGLAYRIPGDPMPATTGLVDAEHLKPVDR